MLMVVTVGEKAKEGGLILVNRGRRWKAEKEDESRVTIPRWYLHYAYCGWTCELHSSVRSVDLPSHPANRHAVL